MTVDRREAIHRHTLVGMAAKGIDVVGHGARGDLAGGIIGEGEGLVAGGPGQILGELGEAPDCTIVEPGQHPIAARQGRDPAEIVVGVACQHPDAR